MPLPSRSSVARGSPVIVLLCPRRPQHKPWPWSARMGWQDQSLSSRPCFRKHSRPGVLQRELVWGEQTPCSRPSTGPTAGSLGLLQQTASGRQLSTARDCHCTTRTRCQQGWLPQRIEGRSRSWPPAASGGCQVPGLMAASPESLPLVTRSLCHMTAWKLPASPRSSRYKSLDLVTSAKPLLATQVTPHRALKSLGVCPAHHTG